MANKLGSYISSLMAVVVDSEQEQFVKDLAFNELKRLNVDISNFLAKNDKDDSEDIEKTEKILLQEQEENKENKDVK